MSTAAQVIVLVIAPTVFVVRLVAALYHARVDGRIAARQRLRAAEFRPCVAPDASGEPGGEG